VTIYDTKETINEVKKEYGNIFSYNDIIWLNKYIPRPWIIMIYIRVFIYTIE
jgi:hypothetical protein